MRVLDILNSPWAILPDKLIEIGDIYFRHLRGEESNFKISIEDDLDSDLTDKSPGYSVVNGVGVVSVLGPIAKRMNMFMNISGGTSTQLLQRNFLAAWADDKVKSILLLVDSPGGTVDGTQAASNLIRSARGRGKPIYALADGIMASAAYWIASAADKIFIIDDTTHVGSIGVVATHVDHSKANEMDGIKVTEITAGKYKRTVSENEPLSKEGRGELQDLVDQIYEVFVNDVAANRNVSVETVLEDMADGRLFIGEKAIAAGLVDGKASYDMLIDMMSKEVNMGVEREAVKPEASSAMDSPAVEVAVITDAIAEKVQEDAPKTEDFTKEPDDKTEGKGDPQMLDEAKIKESLGLKEDASGEDILQALSAAAATRKIISGSGDVQVVSIYDHLKLENRLTVANETIKKLTAELKEEKDQRQQENRQRAAEALVGQAVAEGKISKTMVEEWALKLALEQPREFDNILKSMPRLVSFTEQGSSEPAQFNDATQQIQRLVDLKRAEAANSGKDLSIGEAQRQVALEHPQMYQDHVEHSRRLSREGN